MQKPNTPGGVVAATVDEAASVVLRGATVHLDSELGRAFVTDCARFSENLLSATEVCAKWGLTETAWTDLGKNAALLDAVRAERSRRIGSGEAVREAAQLQLLKAPDVLGGILTSEQAPARHRVEAARELRQAAGHGSEAASNAGERHTITINLGPDQTYVFESDAKKKTTLVENGEGS